MIFWLLRSEGSGRRPATTYFRFGEALLLCVHALAALVLPVRRNQSHLPGNTSACDSLRESRVILGLRPLLRVVSSVRPSTVSQLSRPSLADFRYIGRKLQ